MKYTFGLGLVLYSYFTYGQVWKNTLDSCMEVVSQNGMFNGQITLAENDKIVFSKAYGYFTSKKINSSTSLPIASLSKPMTAAGILILEEKGMVRLDDKIEKYIPGFLYNITVQQLLNQTSGIPRFLATAIKYGDTSRVMERSEMIKLIMKIKPGAGIPGEKFSYNNSNYILAREIIEIVSDMTFPNFMAKFIFDPLNMNNSKIINTINSNKTDNINSNNFYQPDKEILSTSEDLMKFAIGLTNHKIISDSSKELAFTKQLLNDGSYSSYGLGWYLLETPESKSVGHWGGGEGIKSYMEIYLTECKKMTMITHNSTQYIDNIYEMIKNIWHSREYKIPQNKSPYVVDSEILKEYVGSYLSPAFGLLHVTFQNNKLYLRPDAIAGREELIPASDSTFYFNGQDLDWEFYRDNDGRVIGFGFMGKKSEMGVKQ